MILESLRINDVILAFVRNFNWMIGWSGLRHCGCLVLSMGLCVSSCISLSFPTEITEFKLGNLCLRALFPCNFRSWLLSWRLSLLKWILSFQKNVKKMGRSVSFVKFIFQVDWKFGIQMNRSVASISSCNSEIWKSTFFFSIQKQN